MKFFNYHFHQIRGISKANWNPYTMIDWKQQGLPFIDFGTRVDFGQHHPDYNQVRLRVGNWRLTLHFDFVNCEFENSYTGKVSDFRVTKGFARYSDLSVEDIRNSASLLSKAGVTTEQVIENIKRLTSK
jgi:hypothetical protein